MSTNEQSESEAMASVEPLEPVPFRRLLRSWYLRHARELPWRGVFDPYHTWLSEIMLQQTRVAAVIDRFRAFVDRFPSVAELAVASEDDVLALWSGLGYYRRARMLHRGAQFVLRELEGHLPRTAEELRTLPGVGAYTSAAIASIAFGESAAVLDGNVERVLLRILGLPELGTPRDRLQTVAQELMPGPSRQPKALRDAQWKAEALSCGRALRDPAERGPRPEPVGQGSEWVNLPGDHNQAMMELGATICLPQRPLCLQCPVMRFCRTRGEHRTERRRAPLSRKVAYLLTLRKRGVTTELLLVRRPMEASLMPGMLELPPLPPEAVEEREPVLRVRHSITQTNYYVEIYAESASDAAVEDGSVLGAEMEAVDEDERVFRSEQKGGEGELMAQIPVARTDQRWVPTARLGELPLTGLARKVLMRLKVMAAPTVVSKVRR